MPSTDAAHGRKKKPGVTGLECGLLSPCQDRRSLENRMKNVGDVCLLTCCVTTTAQELSLVLHFPAPGVSEQLRPGRRKVSVEKSASSQHFLLPAPPVTIGHFLVELYAAKIGVVRGVRRWP